MKLKKITIIIIGATLLASCKVSKPNNETEKKVFFKWKHKKDNDK